MSDSNKVKVDWNEKLILQDRLGREGKMGLRSSTSSGWRPSGR